ncbi:MAG: TonB-dependent siderophore receptor [Candidatus Methylopumilus sp.]|jgi:iron complex outermembrane receptor protein
MPNRKDKLIKAIAIPHRKPKKQILGLLPSLTFTITLATSGINIVYADTKKDQKGNESVETLQEVKVKAETTDLLPQPYAGGQTARGGRLGLLGNSDIMKTPFSTSSYTSQMILDQQAQTAADVLSKDSSIRSSGQTGGIFDSFFIRGFPLGEGNAGEIAFDGVYGVAPNYRIMTAYAERIEVIKGPAALLYGMSPNSGVGGVINIVPKRAGSKDLTRFTADYLSSSQIGGNVDLSRRFGDSKQFGVRVNGSHHEGDTPLDNQSRKADVGSIALDYQGEKLRSSLDVIWQKERFDAPSRPFFLPTGGLVPSAPDGRRNVTQSWEWAKVEDRSVLLKTEYDLTDKLTVFASAGTSKTDVSRLFGAPTILNATGDTSSRPDYFIFDINRSTYETGIRSRFETGVISHKVSLQASHYEDRIDRGSTNGTSLLSNIYDPVDRSKLNVLAPSRVPKLSETSLTGVALADTLSIMDDRLQLTLGVRKQQVKVDNFNPTTGAVTTAYDKSAVTPLVGIVVQPWQNVSFYGNYIEGLSKGDSAPLSATNAGEAFAPYKSKQKEVGIKVDYGRFISTLSAFQITKPSGQLTNNVFAVDGEQRNRGLELNVFGEIASGIRLLSGVTWIDAELTKTNSLTTIGNTPVGVPSSQANLGGEWDIVQIPGLTLTGAVVYTDKQYVNQANTQILPSWTKVDLGARYKTSLGGNSTTFRATVLNAFDRDYWSGVASYSGFVQGAPRTLLMSATVDF